jgi:hypothetical protein
MAEDRATAARKKSGGLARQWNRRGVRNRVHPGVLDPQQGAVDHVGNRARMQARGQQLLTRHEAALDPRNRRDSLLLVS